MKIFLIALLFISVQTFAQGVPNLTKSLTKVKVINSQQLPTQFAHIVNVDEPNTLIGEEKPKGTRRLLHKQGADKWVVYALSELNLVDANFDGLTDLKLSCDECSGAANDFEYIYLFDHKTNTYKYSKLLSGAGIEIDAVHKTLNKTFNNGGNEYDYLEIEFGNNGIINDTRAFNSKIDDSSKDTFKYSYEKKVGDKVIFRSSKIVTRDVDFFEWLGAFKK